MFQPTLKNTLALAIALGASVMFTASYAEEFPVDNPNSQIEQKTLEAEQAPIESLLLQVINLNTQLKLAEQAQKESSSQAKQARQQAREVTSKATRAANKAKHKDRKAIAAAQKAERAELMAKEAEEKARIARMEATELAEQAQKLAAETEQAKNHANQLTKQAESARDLDKQTQEKAEQAKIFYQRTLADWDKIRLRAGSLIEAVETLKQATTAEPTTPPEQNQGENVNPDK
jgi:chromosome segregation ATPase